MTETTKPTIDVELLEQLVKAHVGPEFTAKLTWSVLRNRHLPSETPGRLACPRKVFGFLVSWTTVGEFRTNLGFRLELWDPSFLPAAQALTQAFNARTAGAKLELDASGMHWPASPQLSSASAGR
jgi:hypothetical protein